jgi:hypothetical protein
MTDPGEWLIGTAKRNPEALLVLAAGCALLLRSSGSFYGAGYSSGFDASGSSRSSHMPPKTEEPAGIGGDMKDRIADASASVAQHGRDVARTVSTQTSQIAGQAQSMLSNGFGQLLREQPLALVAAGLAAGAAVAALLPATELEERALGGARDAISDMAATAAENLVEAAKDTGQKVTQQATDRAAEQFKEVAKDAVAEIAQTVSGVMETGGKGPENKSPTRSRDT